MVYSNQPVCDIHDSILHTLCGNIFGTKSWICQYIGDVSCGAVESIVVFLPEQTIDLLGNGWYGNGIFWYIFDCIVWWCELATFNNLWVTVVIRVAIRCIV